ncbi:MAG TPA: hypothetical protein VE553_07000 [Candidatus Binatia bacterium]|nr:hypothetical protein [Candidatus Binatia bacterium]
MNMKHLKIADLDDEAVDSIRDLEDALGAHILALEPQVTLRELDEDEMRKLRRLEDELGVILIAYNPVS